MDDDAALRRTMCRMLAETGILIKEFESAADFLEGYSARPLGCVLLDVRLPDLNGLDLLEHIADLPPHNPVIMVSGYGDIPSAVRAVKIGAIDFIQKPFRKDQLVDVLNRGFKKLETIAIEDRNFETLTPRERDVLMTLRDGAPNKIAAAALGLSPRTVEMHRARILKKLGVNNLTQALMRARDARVIP
ncbi:MAG TPA: response regulator [Sphingomicrobium sp.]|nr:response regulator [Sphingomicrobium sp.]